MQFGADRLPDTVSSRPHIWPSESTIRFAFAGMSNIMVSRMTADSFTMDVYCTCLNSHVSDNITESGDSHGVTALESHDTKLPISSRSISRPRCGLRYVAPRLIWLVIGPVVLMILSVLKLESRTSQAGILDTTFIAVTIALFALRWATWLAGDKCDSFGAKMSRQGLVGFTVLLTITASAVWGLASLLASQH